MAPPTQSKQPRLAPLKPETTNLASAKSGKDGMEGPSPSALVQEILKLEDQSDIEKKAIEIKGKLSAEWKKGADRNVALLDDLLQAAKILLTKLTYIPLKLDRTASQKQVLLAREILEIGAKASVAKRTDEGIAEFERYMAQLKQYYFDLKPLFPQDSESMYEILGMNLLKLLSQNRISEFHTELELFVHPDVSKVLNNVYIRKAVEIEQFLTEGRYNKVVALHTANDEELKRTGLTSSGFKFFIDRVVVNSRGVISDVLETAFDRVNSEFIQQALNIQSPHVLKQVVEERKWKLGEDGYVYFHATKNFAGTIPSAKLAVDALKYAKELDTIV